MRGRTVRNILLALVAIGLVIWGVIALNNRVKEPPAPPVDPVVNDPTPDPVDNLGGETLEVKEPQEPAAAPVVEKKVVLPEKVDQTTNYWGLSSLPDFRAQVNEPGEHAFFILDFKVQMEDAVLVRIWPDDILISAKIYFPGQSEKDITDLFGMISVPAGGTKDASLDAVLESRGVNVEAGESLPQNRNAVSLGDVPAGTIIVFEVKDDENKGVNRGMGYILESGFKDAFTVTLP